MTTGKAAPMMHVALLRGVNVGGNRKVAMADLRAMAADLEFERAQTLLASGNLVFDSSKLTGDALEALLEREAKARLGLETHFLVRSAAEWEAVIAGNPLREQAEAAPSRFAVVVMKTGAKPEALKILEGVAADGELIRAGDRALYVAFPNGMGRSKLGTAISGTKLGPATARNWNTVTKLAAMMR